LPGRSLTALLVCDIVALADPQIVQAVMRLIDQRGVLQAAALLLIAFSLKASAGQSLSRDADILEKPPAAAPLPDIRTLLDRQQLLRDRNKFQLCTKEIAEIIDPSDLTLRVAHPNWVELESQARKLGIATAFLDAKAVFEKNISLLRRKDGFGIAIYSRTEQKKRKIFLADLVKARIDSFDIQHGRGTFQNEGHNRSSLGCFVAGMNIKDVAFSLHGFDGSLNSCACERRLQVHISQSWGASRSPSFGCLTLRRGSNRYRAIAAALSGGGLICAYDEGRVPDRR
jgi:hypothetical protein